MDVFEAIKKMRELTGKGIPFSFSFMSYSMDKNKSDGIIEVSKAKLRKQSKIEDNRFADIMINYYDVESHEYGQCYQPLLLEFNGVSLELN